MLREIREHSAPSRARCAGIVGVGVALLMAVAAVAGCGGGSGGGSDSPITIGFMSEVTGPFAANGKDLRTGWNLGIKDAGGTVNGHKVETKVVDEAGDPGKAVTLAHQLVQAQGVDLLVGPQASNAGLAIQSYVKSKGIPTIYPGCGIEPTQGTVVPNIVLTGWTCDQPTLVFGKYAHDSLHYNHITTVGLDYAFGWQSVGGFAKAFTDAGGTVDKQIWIPTSASDYSSYMSQIPRNTDAVFALMAGSPSAQFTSAYNSFGLKGKVPLIGSGTLTDYSVLPSEGQKDITGLVTALQYADGLKTAANQKFVKEFRAAAGKYPSYYAEDGYTSALIAMDALKQVKGDTGDQQALVKALQHAHVDAPRGPVSISPTTNSPVQNVYIRRVESVGGQLRNVPISTAKAVQPWDGLQQSVWEQLAAHYSRSTK